METKQMPNMAKNILYKIIDHFVGLLLAIPYHLFMTVYYSFKKKHSIRKTGRVTQRNPYTDKW